MGGVPILLALAAVTVDYGYQPDGKGGVEYIVQVTPEEFEYAKKAGEISSSVDASVRGRVTRFVLRVGSGPLPRDAGPQPDPATVAQAQGFESLADRNHVPIPEMPDTSRDDAAPPIPALTMQTPAPVTRAKPQETPGMSMPTGSGTPLADDARDAAGGVQDPSLRRLQASGPNAANPIRTAASTTAPPATGTATPFPSTSAAAAPPSAAAPPNAAGSTYPGSSPGLQVPSTSETARDSQWDRQPTATRQEPSTRPRTPSTASNSAVGNFGAPPPGIEDRRLSTTTGSQLGNPQTQNQNPYQQPTQNQNQNQPAGMPATAQAGNGYNYGAAAYPGQPGGAQPNPGQPDGAQPPAGGQLASGSPTAAANPYPGATYPANNYPANTYPPGGYQQGSNPQGSYPQGSYPPSGYGPSGQLAANDPTGNARGATGLLPDGLTNVNNPNAAGRPGGSGSALNGPGDEEENRGLPQQVFNLLLLLSLIANAYLVIQMSKLIQRYRDLRVNLRAATSGNSPPSPATV